MAHHISGEFFSGEIISRIHFWPAFELIRMCSEGAAELEKLFRWHIPMYKFVYVLNVRQFFSLFTLNE